MKNTTESLGMCKKFYKAYKSLQDIIAILGMDELSEEDKLTVARAKKNTKIPLTTIFVAEVFYGITES